MSWRQESCTSCFETLRMLPLPRPPRLRMPTAKLSLPKTLLVCKVFSIVTASWSGCRCRSRDKRPNTSSRDVYGEMPLDLQIAFELFVKRWTTDLEHPLVAERLLEISLIVYWVASIAILRSPASPLRDALMARLSRKTTRLKARMALSTRSPESLK